MDSASENDRPLMSWLTTGALVLVGVTMGGIVIAVLAPPRKPATADTAAQTATQTAAPASPGVASRGPAAANPTPNPVPSPAPTAVAATPAAPIAMTPAPSPNPTPLPVAAQPLPVVTPQTPVAGSESPPARLDPATQPATTSPSPDSEATDSSGEPSADAKAAAPQAENADKRAAFDRAVMQTRLAMRKRDLKMAKSYLQAIEGNVQSPADQAQLERTQLLLDTLEQFWGEVRKAVSKLQPTEELELKDNRVAVIEANRDQLVIQMNGRSHRYRIMELPPPVLQAIVDQSFTKSAGSFVVVGCFLAMDRQGDRKQARKLWKMAAQSGETLGKQLMPELDLPVPSEK